MSDSQTNAAKGNLLQRIVAQIEEDIVLGRLHPRERLVEEELLTRFDAKRHVVRQALFELERMGLVERLKNRGSSVRAYTPQEVEDLYAMRELLEVAGARFIPLPLEPATIERLEHIQRCHDQAVERRDRSGIFRHNLAFHRALFDACGNPYLAQSIEEFARKAHAIRFLRIAEDASVELARREHWEIIQALRSEDRERLVDVCRRHLLPSKEKYLAMYQTGADPARPATGR